MNTTIKLDSKLLLILVTLVSLLVPGVAAAEAQPAATVPGTLTYDSGPVFVNPGYQWTYTVFTGRQPAVSHVEFYLCVPCNEIIATSDTRSECKKSGDRYMLKFETGFGVDNAYVTVWFVLSTPRVAANTVPYGLKSGTEPMVLGTIRGPVCDVPMAVTLRDSSLTPGKGGVVVAWETASEVSTLGYHLYRSRTNDINTATRITPQMIFSEAPGSIMGAKYAYTDATAMAGVTYYYWLEDIDIMIGPGDAPYLPNVNALGAGRWNMPRSLKVNPYRGASLPLLGQRFNAFFQDKDGDLAYTYLLVNSQPTLQGGLAVRYEVATGLFSVYDQRLNQWLPGIAPGVRANLECPAGKLNVYLSSAQPGSSGTLKITAMIRFGARFTGQKQIWLMAEDAAGNSSGWVAHGNWTILSLR